MTETDLTDQDLVVETMRDVLAKDYGIVRSLDLEEPIDTLGLDSVAFVEYVFDLETALNLVLPDVPRDLQTLGDVVRFVTAEVQRQRSEARHAEAR